MAGVDDGTLEGAVAVGGEAEVAIGGLGRSGLALRIGIAPVTAARGGSAGSRCTEIEVDADIAAAGAGLGAALMLLARSIEPIARLSISAR